MRSMWGRCEVDVGSMWGRCGVDVGSMWNRCEVDVWSMRSAYSFSRNQRVYWFLVI